MLYLIGLGLWDEGDVPLKAIEAMKKCDSIYVEFYTNKWHGSLERLEGIIGKKITVLKRTSVESEAVTDEAKGKNVALLIPGDPLAATTHIQLLIDAKEKNVPWEVVHASSIYSSIAETGLQLYKFGRTTTLTFPEESFKPNSPYEMIIENGKVGLHTLVLLDIREAGLMTIKDGIEVLTELGLDGETKIIACCQLGSPKQIIRYGKMKELAGLQGTPAAIVIPGKLHFKEEEALQLYE